MSRTWVHDTFSLGSLLAGLKSLAWVLPLSLLIWVYAERAQVVPLQAFPFTVQVHSADPTRVIRLLDPADGKVHGEVSGPQGRLDQVREKLESGALILQIDIPDGQLTPGPHQILTSLVEHDPRIEQNGITITKCVPHEISVYVDRLEQVELEVEAPDVKNLVSAPVFGPTKVKVTAPHSLIASAKASRNLLARVNLDGIRDALAPGTHDLTAVPVLLPFDKTLTPTPAVVSAHYEVKKSDASMVIDSMPIWVIWPPNMADLYKAEYEPFLAGVTVIGPEEQIKAMKEADFKPKPKAVFEVSAADLSPTAPHERILKFDLPSDVHVSPDDAKRMVQFKLVERKAE